MLDCVLIYPPLANPFYPYLSTPTLSSYIKEKGYTVEQRDINLELYEIFFSTEFINKLQSRIENRIEELDNKESLNWKQQEEYVQLICLKLSLENTINSFDISLEEVKEKFRDINSYRYENDEPVLLDAWNYFQRINTIINYLISPLQLPICDTKSVIKAINKEEYYLFYDIYEDFFVKDILKDNPKFVGISITYQTQVIPALYLGYLLKKHNPDIHLCIGGQHLSTISHDIHDLYKDLTFIDSIVVDEGEPAIIPLLEFVNGKGSIDDIPNLFHIRDNKVIENKRTVLENIKDAPLPDFDGLPLDKYFTGSIVLPYSASKGCYYNKCTFCSFPFISPKYRIKTPEEVAEDLAKLSEKYNVKLFYLTNEADPPKRIKQLSEEIIKKDIGIYYHSFCRFDRKVDKETIDLLHESGCRVLFFGLEAASDRVNEMMMNKGIRLDKAKEILEYCYNVGISTVVSSIIAFPTETLEESIMTKKFLEDGSFYKNHVPQSHDFRLPRGTDTEISHQKYGVTKLYRNEGNLSTILSNYETSYKKIPYEERNKARINHFTVDYWPHHDCIELLYSLYYNGDIPEVFSYKKQIKPKENKIKVRNYTPYNYNKNNYNFEELIKRKEFRMRVINNLYRKGYFDYQIEEIIDKSILGKNINQYEISFLADFNKIQNFVADIEKDKIESVL